MSRDPSTAARPTRARHPLLNQLPDLTGFPTVVEQSAWSHELADSLPRTVQLVQLGLSRAGRPIEMLSIRHPRSTRQVLVVGQPHPNEPIGMATVRLLAERLSSDPDALQTSGCDWHLVICADPDATRLNEGWFAGPFTREHYARNFYRPGSDQQVEWTFPFHTDDFVVDSPMPETRALMAAIDAIRPDVLASLHNGELGGGYFYASTNADSAWYESLGGLCAEYGVPLHLGDPETPFSTRLAPAVYSVPEAAQVHAMATASGIDPAALITGGSSLDYARQRGGDPLAVVIELPYWRDERSDDLRPDPSGCSRREVTLAGLALQSETVQTLKELMRVGRPDPDSPLTEAVSSFLAMDERGYLQLQLDRAMADPLLDAPATVADVFSTVDNVHMFRLRLGGMLLRAFDEGSPAYEQASATFAAWCAEEAANSRAEAIPIQNLVAVQAEAVLSAATYVTQTPWPRASTP